MRLQFSALSSIFFLKFLLICSVWTSYKVIAIEGFVPQSYRIPYCVFGSLSVVVNLIVLMSRAMHALWLRHSLHKIASSNESAHSESELIAQLTWGANLGILALFACPIRLRSAPSSVPFESVVNCRAESDLARSDVSLTQLARSLHAGVRPFDRRIRPFCLIGDWRAAGYSNGAPQPLPL